MNQALKELLGRIDVDVFQRLMTHSILRTPFAELGNVPIYSTREELWSNCIERAGGHDALITYVEYGVFEGYSINHFARTNKNQASVFIGLDSFEGLPEDWGPTTPKGLFNRDGATPQPEDCRVSFIKGWFQDTSEKLGQQLLGRRNLIIHYDADLYSSTLFALAHIDTLKQTYLAIFDEFTGHEARALYNYLQAYSAGVKFFGKVLRDGLPKQVLCRISPHVSLDKPDDPERHSL